MPDWFEGKRKIDCALPAVRRALDDPGELYVGIVSLMPGMTSVELVEQTSDTVTIRTNEGLMNRTNISRSISDERFVVELDERYQAGSAVTTTSHLSHEFTPTDVGVVHRLVISDVNAPGFMGFFYKAFGSSRTGKAFLDAYQSFFEKQPG